MHICRLKRSNSQEFDDKIEDFKRAGLRSTAGPRLGGWNRGIESVFRFQYVWNLKPSVYLVKIVLIFKVMLKEYHVLILLKVCCIF